MPGNEWAATTKRIKDAILVLAIGFPMTLRQLFYRLVSTKAIRNCQAHYQRLSRDMKKARQEERVPWDWIVDRSRPTYAVNAFCNLREYGNAVLAASGQACSLVLFLGSGKGECRCGPLKSDVAFASATMKAALRMAPIFSSGRADLCSK